MAKPDATQGHGERHGVQDRRGLFAAIALLFVALVGLYFVCEPMGGNAPVTRPVVAAQLPAAPPPPAAPTMAPPAKRRALPLPVVVGALEGPAALDHFYEALAQLDNGHASDDVRIVQFGDSHTASDSETGPLRRALQARFGDGGRGFVALGRPWDSYGQDGIQVIDSTGWSPAREAVVRGTYEGDGQYGLLGVSLESSTEGARAATFVSGAVSKVELAFLEQPDGGCADVLVDGKKAGRIESSNKKRGTGYCTVDLDGARTAGRSPAPPRGHQIEIKAAGDGPVRVFGMALDGTATGLMLDALGINGARVADMLMWNEPHFVEQLGHRAPDLVVLAYGTNETGDYTPMPTYERQLADVLGRVARAAPDASCILMGPPDRAVEAAGEWTTIPRLIEIAAAQRRAASLAGCAYYSQLDAMGGPGTIAGWAVEAPPRAMPDRVHLSRAGYATLGRKIAEDVIASYASWRLVKGLPAAQARPGQRGDSVDVAIAPAGTTVRMGAL